MRIEFNRTEQREQSGNFLFVIFVTCRSDPIRVPPDET